MHRGFFISACIFSVLAVVLGAFGAHALKDVLTGDLQTTFETAVRYQFYHAVGLFITAFAFDKLHRTATLYAGYSFLIGIILFSGSLYLLTWLKSNDSVGMKGIGMVTPFGGLFFILGWVLLIVGVWRRRIV